MEENGDGNSESYLITGSLPWHGKEPVNFFTSGNTDPARAKSNWYNRNRLAHSYSYNKTEIASKLYFHIVNPTSNLYKPYQNGIALIRISIIAKNEASSNWFYSIRMDCRADARYDTDIAQGSAHPYRFPLKKNNRNISHNLDCTGYTSLNTRSLQQQL